jgi:TRAP-type C4-dicarboxylate transport system substrate-binding protein
VAVKKAIAFQRNLAIDEDRESRAAIEAAGCVIGTLTPDEHAQFRAAVTPLLNDARKSYDDKMFKMI